MHGRDALHDQPFATHRAMMDQIANVPHIGDVSAVIASLVARGRCLLFQAGAGALFHAYGAPHPDQRLLPLRTDACFIRSCLPYGLHASEQRKDVDCRAYPEGIWGLLKERPNVNGLGEQLRARSPLAPAS